MQLRFLGGAGTVTGTKVLIEAGGRRLLIDCGLFRGVKQLRVHNWSALPVPTGSIDAVVLTHAHIDHSGFLPRMVDMGFEGKVHATPATAALCQVLLPETGRLLEEEAGFANRQGYARHEPALPLYTEQGARQALERLQPHAFGEAFEPVPGFECRLLPAGHVLGAASVHLRCGDRSLLVSGDLGTRADPVMPRPAPAVDADLVLLESTHGDRRHRSAEALSRLAKLINRTASRGGVLLVPAHAAGDAQMLLRAIARLKAASRVPALPVHLNNSVAAKVTELYRQHAGEHKLSADECAALLDGVSVAQDDEQAMSLNHLGSASILIAIEGVGHDAGVAHHLKAYAADARNTIVFLGHQTAGTRAAALLAGQTELKIHGDWITVRAEVCALDALSVHADRQELLDWVLGLPRAPRHVYLMHGEPEAADSLRQAIVERTGWNCSVPEYGDLVNV